MYIINFQLTENQLTLSMLISLLVQKVLSPFSVFPSAQMLSESDTQAFKAVCEAVSAEMNYHRYRMELRGQQMVPCVPLLGK